MIKLPKAFLDGGNDLGIQNMRAPYRNAKYENSVWYANWQIIMDIPFECAYASWHVCYEW